MEEDRSAAGGFVIPQSYSLQSVQVPGTQLSQIPAAQPPSAPTEQPPSAPTEQPPSAPDTQSPQISSDRSQNSEAINYSNANQSSPLNSQVSGAAESWNQSSVSALAEELLKFKKLLDEGIINDSEFEEIKSKIISARTGNF
jgi:hypothetical protein